MLADLKLNNVLFLDTETVPIKYNFEELSPDFQTLWEEKTFWQRKEEFTPAEFYKKKAGVMAEFAKVVCISVGYLFSEKGENHFRIKSFYADEEKELLSDFILLLNEGFNTKSHLLCAHNGKEFDFPYIARRMIINNIELPHKLNLFGKKPWEVPHLDTLELWKFGDYKNYTSLKLLTHVLGIPSPKQDIDGSEVYSTFYKEKDIDRIINYCERDTLAVAQIILRLRSEELLHDNEIKII